MKKKGGLALRLVNTHEKDASVPTWDDILYDLAVSIGNVTGRPVGDRVDEEPCGEGYVLTSTSIELARDTAAHIYTAEHPVFEKYNVLEAEIKGLN